MSLTQRLVAALRTARPYALTTDGQRRAVTARWRGNRCQLTLAEGPARVREIVLFDGPHGLPAETPLYGEAFQMLSQLAGTLGQPVDVGTYPDRSHYRIPEPENLRTAYGTLLLAPPGAERVLLGFTSCQRFAGRLSFEERRLRVSLDTEGLLLPAGAALEEFGVWTSTDPAVLFDQLTKAIAQHHPRLAKAPVPTGWCSWYTFGPEVTAQNVADNLDWIAEHLPALRYIQIDDGYQPHMGDWLDTGKAFGGDIRAVLRLIRQKGFAPAIWVAPFIADGQSRLFREHPEWFVKDESGAPMPSSKVGFGGWRLGPWYSLDGTHPGAQAHLEQLFRTLRHEWGCTYFKLDANYWGAIHGGHRHDPNATRIEAYRRGMEAILRGAGHDSVILGCNHPIWPSLGLIHASRSSNDIGRSWADFRNTGRENLLRGWQNGRFWWNDPDCVLLTGDLPEHEYLYHATLLYATGGMVLSGDDMPLIPPQRLALLKKLLPATGVAARFTDECLQLGRIPLRGKEHWAVFNHGETPLTLTLPLTGTWRLTDFWTGTALGTSDGPYTLEPLLPHHARLIEARRA